VGSRLVPRFAGSVILRKQTRRICDPVSLYRLFQVGQNTVGIKHNSGSFPAIN
jgi:hypothetical protein